MTPRERATQCLDGCEHSPTFSYACGQCVAAAIEDAERDQITKTDIPVTEDRIKRMVLEWAKLEPEDVQRIEISILKRGKVNKLTINLGIAEEQPIGGPRCSACNHSEDHHGNDGCVVRRCLCIGFVSQRAEVPGGILRTKESVCIVHDVSSRVCERGTKSCITIHPKEGGE